MNRHLARLIRLLRILAIPGALRHKVSQPAFSLVDFETCDMLARSGVRPTLVVDVGANVGQFALAALNQLQPRRVLSFEPVSEPFVQLTRLATEFPQIEPRPLALAAEAGERQIRVTNVTQSSSFLPLHENHLQAYPGIREDRVETVRVSTLDEEMKEVPADDLIFLKLDVQGYELEVLRGATQFLRRVSWIMVECASRPYYEGSALAEDIVDFLKHQGFLMSYPVSIHQCPDTGSIEQFDLLFSRRGED